MNPSSNFQTGSVLLLTATVVCGALGVTLVVPMLQRDSFARTKLERPQLQQTVEPVAPEKFSEFYPTIEDGRRELKRLEAAAGPLPQAIRPARLASDSKVGRRYMPPVRVQQQPFVHRSREPVASEPQPASTVEAATVQHYSPQQLPPGTVYAPVTVNVDSSALAEQMQQMSVRFEELVAQKNQAAAAAILDKEQKQIARKQRQRHRPPVDPQSQEKIVLIEAGLLQLAESVNALQSRTQADMQELVQQKSRAEAASQLLESYERTLSARLQDIEASHAELKAPTKIALAPDETYSDAVPFPVEPPVVASAEPASEPLWDASPDTVPEVTQELILPAGEVEFVPSSLPEPAGASEQLPVQELFEPPAAEPEVSAVPELFIEALPSEDSLVPEESDASALVVEAVEPQSLLRIPVQSLSPIPPPAPPVTTLQDITPPETAPLLAEEAPALPVVGFENVYRFKLANVEAEEGPTVVPGDGPVCQQCGLIHGPGESHAHQHLRIPPAPPVKIQTVSNTNTLKPRPVSSTNVPPSKPQSKKIINRTAARGSNRHVLNARHSESAKPVWDVQLPSMGAKVGNDKLPAAADRPSFMHRVGATFKQLTR